MASNNFINECKNGAFANRLGKIIVDGMNTPITNSENLKKITIDSGCYVDGSIIGSIYIKQLTGELIGYENTDSLIEKEIEAQIGVKYGDKSTEYISMGKYTIERPKEQETANKAEITAYDNIMNKINDKYVCGLDYENDTITLEDLYIDVCDNLSLTPATTNFLNKDIPINANPFTNGETNYTVLQTVAKIACSFVTIDNNTDEINLSWLSDSVNPDYTFQKSDYSTLEGGIIELGPINSVTIKNSQVDSENVTQTDSESILANGEHSIVISEDYILYNSTLRSQALSEIFNRLNGFRYTDCKLTTYYGKPFLPIGSKIRVITDNGYLDTFVLIHKFEYDGTFTSTIESPVLTEQEIRTKQNITLKDALKNTEIEVNKQKQTITSIVSYASEQDERISQVVQTVDEINTKVSDVVDLTISNESLSGFVTINDINESEPIEINIHPISDTILNLYPNNNLFPNDNLFLKDRILKFKNIRTGEIVSYELPCDLLLYDSNIYDEFILNYSEKICKVIKRCSYDENNNIYKLENEIIEEFDYPTIPLSDGNYIIFLSGYASAYIYVKLMKKNEYTTTFATKVEMNSAISQTASEISLEVNDKVDQDEIIAKLNVAIEDKQGVINITGNQVTIDSDNFQLTSDGSLTCNNGTFNGTINTSSGLIGGFDINESNLSANISDKYTYTSEDFATLRYILAGSITPTAEQIEKYDINHNGYLDTWDRVIMQWKLSGNVSTQGNFKISTEDANNSIVFEGNGDEKFKTAIGISNITSNIMFASQFRAISDDETKDTMITGDGIVTPNVTQTSLASKKKNFKKLENAKEILKSVDIYKYNLIGEEDDDKKSIGFVIGDNFNYSEEITSKNNDGVNLYSMISVLWQVVKEQQNEIEKLNNEIKIVKNGD